MQRFHVNIEIAIPDGTFQPQISLSDCAPEQIDMLLASALQAGAIRWASITRVPETIRKMDA